ncbi:MAG TPA: glucose-1-phosphate adenylyltransferase [Mycobacteriales bacterium]|nr:glucose-1-phosphate adenylyltransferase [Mycobacteriales bacterium]
MPRTPHVLAMVLAGGEGKRLSPLTADRAKPAVPFGGNYRLVDFVLSNLVNGGLRQIVVLTQYKSHSLDRHIAQTWRLSPVLGNYVAPVPAQMRHGPHWFSGSADAIFQNLNLIYDEQPEHICVFGADHIYRMDPRQMLAQHIDTGAAVTVAAIRVPIEQASSFGVIETDGATTITGFREKPVDAVGLPDAPHQVYASMGNYIFRTESLIQAVTADAATDESSNDLGGNIMPMMVEGGAAQVYDFATNDIPGSTERDHAYWRDVGTLDAYYDAHMDLISVHPIFNLYNEAWPIYSWQSTVAPAKFVFDEDGRRGQALSSIVSPGVIVSGGTVRGSVLGPRVTVGAGALVEGSVLMDGVRVGDGAVVHNAILDKFVEVPAGARVGVNPVADRQHYTVSENGIVVIGKHQSVVA